MSITKITIRILFIFNSCFFVKDIYVQSIDFILDLDGLFLFKNIASDAPLERIIQAGGKNYRIAEYTVEFLEFLDSIPGSRVSFYSAVSNVRN
jgi:hypothetical protein